MRLQRKHPHDTGGWLNVLYPTDTESKLLIIFDLTFNDVTITRITVESLYAGDIYIYRAIADEGGAGDRAKLIPPLLDPEMAGAS